MSENKKNLDAEQVVGEATIESVKFIEKYKKQLLAALLAIVIIALAIFAYDKFYSEPRSEEAMAQTFVAEHSAAQGLFFLCSVRRSHILCFHNGADADILHCGL